MRFAFLTALLVAALQISAEAPASQPISSILFVGNSLTYENDLPSMVCRLAAEAGHRVRCDSVTRANFALSDHWEEGTAAKRLARRNWSVVVMQQGPSGGDEGRDVLLDYGSRWAERIASSGGRVAFYMVWPAAARSRDFPRVSETYRMASEKTNGIFLPAGNAWLEAWRRDRTLRLYGPDGFHPSPAGSYLAALTIYRVLFGEIPSSFASLETARRAAGQPLLLTEAQLHTLVEAAEAAH